MNAVVAAAGFKIVMLMSLSSVQVVLPGLDTHGASAARQFPNTAAGTNALVAWLQAKLPAPGWNAAPTQVCVVGAQAFSAQQVPYIAEPLYQSLPPWHKLEPYAASFHYVAAGGHERTMAQALQICNAGPAR